MKPLVIVTIALAFIVGSLDAFELKETFRTPKNILFGTVGGGSSHINWVLSILDELADRGHNITYVTHDKETAYSKIYPRLNTISIGPNDIDLSVVGNQARHLDNAGFFNRLYKLVHKDYNYKMNKYKEILDVTPMDAALCDHFTVPCIDITKNLNVPLIITAALAISQDATAPYINNFLESNDSTTLNMSFVDRLIAKVVEPLSIVLDVKRSIDAMKKKKADLGWLPTGGMPALEDDWKDALKIVNNLFGFEPARPLGPLVELVGPIMPKNYPDPSPELRLFLKTHNKVAYVAFGQSVEIEQHEIIMILTALIDSIERGALDCIIWATRNSRERFPTVIESTTTNTVYNVEDLFQEKNPHIRFVEWAPQMAILSHPSTVLFVTHGGLGSLHESMYAGVRTALMPYYGDQPSNSYMMRTQNLGIELNADMDQKTASEIIERIALDEDDKFQHSVNRFQALVQIHSRNGIKRAADLVEEVLFTHENGLLRHRFEASRYMSSIKSQNLDLLAFLIILTLGFIVAAICTVRYAYHSYVSMKETLEIRESSRKRLAEVAKEQAKLEKED
ncbi:glycosyltransferase family 1 protein [Backusella circina FSU 941]|nr:glycosyltransferase family 1 protein [Backusella circina FSU 941]